MNLANAADDGVAEALAEIASAVQLSFTSDSSLAGSVFVARDTRSHSERLCALVLRGAALLGASTTDWGLLTTPQLHHIVRMHNGEEVSGPFVGCREWASEDGYYDMLSEAFNSLVGEGEEKGESAEERGVAPLYVDAAFGVGSLSASKLIARMKAAKGAAACCAKSIRIRNQAAGGDGSQHRLNDGCGAEFVQKSRRPPAGFTADSLEPGARLCSFDGDADRIVYHYWSGDDWRLLDGDKIAVLCADFLMEHMRVLEPVLKSRGETFSVAVVQTAYANGGSTRYLDSIGQAPKLAKTGVKFLHHCAEQYDLSIYFEANGHGTVMFKDVVLERLTALRDDGELSEGVRRSADKMLCAHRLINQAVGDALSDMLFVEAVLSLRGWQLADWDALYTDLPSRQTKLPVRDRSAIVCTADETRCVQPPELQSALDALMASENVRMGRCFVRPSGTEDVVRVYAEAATEEMANRLALQTAQAVHTFAGGTGAMPTSVL